MLRKNSKTIFLRSKKESVEVSFVITIHNHGFILEKVLLGIFSSAKLKFEIIIVDDASKDNSYQILKKFLTNSKLPDNLIKIVYVKNFFQKFEVASDNAGCKLAGGEYLCLVQGDMVLQDKEFDARLASMLNEFEVIGAISGKSVRLFGENSIQKWMKSQGHAFKLPKLLRHMLLNMLRKNINMSAHKKNFSKLQAHQEKFVQIEHYSLSESVDKAFLELGEVNYKITSKGLASNIVNSNKLYVGRLINRGPIFMKRTSFELVNGFNEKIFFQGWDDYEFSTNLLLRGKVVAYSPINFISDADWGATQRKKTVRLIILINIKKIRRNKRRKSAAISNFSSLKLEHEFLGKILRIN